MTTTKPLVYLAGPFTSDPAHNTRNAVETGLELYETGLCAVYIPHLTLLADLIDPRALEFWYQFDLDILIHADHLWRLPGPSKGADQEVEFAIHHKIPVSYNRADVTSWLHDCVPTGGYEDIAAYRDDTGELIIEWAELGADDEVAE